ncbi:MAG: PIN domain-containing protein [Candidatus Aenigmatarchaeota archaeon]|nr:hypothetical protein [Candidatus Aenigmarchaeota archaeon]
MRVLLDTNFLIDVIKFRVNLDEITDLIGANELVIPSSVEKELKKISGETSQVGGYAKAALNLMKEYNIKILKSTGRTDDIMLQLSNEKTLVATNDRELRKRLKALGRKTIYLKSKKHLAIE